MIPLASAMRLHSFRFCNAMNRSCFFSSSFISPSVVSIGPASHLFCCRHMLAGAIHKSLSNVQVMLFSLMDRGGRSCSCRGGYHELKVMCSQASSEEFKGKGFSCSKALQKFALCFALAASFMTTQSSVEPVYAIQSGTASPGVSLLMSGPPIKDPNALLRYALPIDNKPIKDIQKNLENITENLKVPGMKGLNSVGRNIKQAAFVLDQSKAEILADTALPKKEKGEELVDKLALGLQDFQKIVEARDRDSIAPKQKELLDIIGE